MSRYEIRPKPGIIVAYGFDRMIPQPSYFLTVSTPVNGEDEDDQILEEIGFTAGVDKHTFLEAFLRWVPKEYRDSSPMVQQHITRAIGDQPF